MKSSMNPYRFRTKSSMNFYRFRIKSAPYVFIAPFFILFVSFMLYPFAFSIYAAFTEWNGIRQPVFIGLDNFSRLLQDNIFRQSIINGVIIYFMYVPLLVLLALLLAVGLTRPWIKLKSFFRAAVFVPNITAVVAVAFLFRLAFSPNANGLINSFLQNFNPDIQISWFATPMLARGVLALLILWRWLGFNMIIMMAGLSTIDSDLYESAEIDGAGAIKKFTKITIPLMRHSILFICVMSTIGTFSLFAEPMFLTSGGGPMNATISTVLYMYNTAFLHMRFGYASTIAVAYFIIMMLLAAAQFRVNRNKD